MRPQCHHLRVFPAVDTFGKSSGDIIVCHRDQRLDAIFVQLTENIVVELYTLSQGLFLSSGGEKAGPADTHAECLEAHFAEERDVFFVVVIEIDTSAEWKIVFFGVSLILGKKLRRDFQHTAFFAGFPFQKANVIYMRKSTAAFRGGTFVLCCRSCATPQKVIGKISHNKPSLIRILYTGTGSGQTW